MLRITIEGTEYFNEETGEFVTTKEQTLQLEHSLVSISKWEAKWHKPFLATERKTYEETKDYVKCMTINSNVNEMIYDALTEENMKVINDYIQNPMTATWFGKGSSGTSRQIVTSELIYYWMISCEIPFECEKWHLNRLMTLIKVCNEKNSGGKKMSKKDILRQNASINAARKAKYHTRG